MREAYEKHLEGVRSLDVLRWARANDPHFPAPAGKRGVELLYRGVGDLKKWARNRPRARLRHHRPRLTTTGRHHPPVPESTPAPPGPAQKRTTAP